MSPLGMSRLGWTAFALGCLVSQGALHAANVTVSGDDPREKITVAIEDATVDFVLENLHKKYGFEVSGLQPNIGAGEAQTVTLSGNLHGILERLLRNWNHMIIRSPDNPSGIAKVMILNANYGAAPSRPGQVGANGEGADKLLQALTGDGID